MRRCLIDFLSTMTRSLMDLGFTTRRCLMDFDFRSDYGHTLPGAERHLALLWRRGVRGQLLQ